MKKSKFSKIAIIISILCIVIGSFCIGMGLIQGGSVSYLRLDRQTADWWPFDGGFGVSLQGIGYTDEDDDTKSFSKDFSDIRGLHLEMAAADTYLRYGKENKVTFYNIEEKEVTMDSKSNALYLTVKNKRRKGHRRVDITVKNANLKDVYIEVDAGTLHMEQFHPNMLKVTTNAAEVVFDRLQIKSKLELSVNAGSVEANHVEASNTEIDLQAGSLEFEGNLWKKTEIDCDAGSIALQLQDRASAYGFAVDMDMGSIQIGDEEYSGLSKTLTLNPKASNQMEIDCDAGSVEVTFHD